MGIINGTPGDDSLTGTSGDDTFRVFQGGEDTLSGSSGNDVFQFGATLDSGDSIDGGAGTDIIQIAGDYSAGLTFAATTLTSVEKIQLGAGHDYTLTTDDANVAAGETLTVDGGKLGAGDHLDFTGQAETDGNFIIIGGAGGDDIATGAGNDTFKLAAGGVDSVEAGAGKDIFIMGAAFGASDALDGGFDGGLPQNVLRLDGDYSAGVTLGADTIQNIYTFQFGAGHAYKIVADAASFLSGPAVSVQGGNLGAGDTLYFDNSASDANLHFTGGAGDDTAMGGDAQNTFDLSQGGNDTATGGALTDYFKMGGQFTAADTIDGGGGNDVVELTGLGGADTVTFSATTMVNIAVLQLDGGHGGYNLITNDATVAAGATMIIAGQNLGAGDPLAFHGDAETDGHFIIRGGAGDDILNGGALSDTINITKGGDDIARGFGGDDTINAGAALTAADTIDGGAGSDTLILDGDFSSGVTFGTTTMVNVETLQFDAGHSYDLTTNDATVASGQTLTVDATALGASDVLTFDGSAETDGSFVFEFGADFSASDSIDGGAGNDTLILAGGSSGLTLDDTHVQSVETVTLADGASYDNLAIAGDIASGGNLTIDASALTGTNAVTLDLTAATSAETFFTGGAGDDTVVYSDDSFGGAYGYDGGAGFNTIEFTTGGPDEFISATYMANLDKIVLDDDAGQDIIVDGDPSHGGTLAIDGSALTAADGAQVNFSASTVANLQIIGGAGDDTFDAGGAFTPADSIDGGTGNDTLDLNGDYGGDSLVLSATSFTNIDTLKLEAGHSYAVYANDGNVSAGATLTVDASALGAANSVLYYGASETDGSFAFIGGAGSDSFTGGAQADSFTGGDGADILTGGGGADVFVYTTVAQSTSTTYDTITDFDASTNFIDVATTILAIDPATTGSISTASFNSDIGTAISDGLSAQHARVITATAGTLDGHVFLVIDGNGTQGYQAGGDYVIDITGFSGTITAANFI
ncbi:MAG: beta strand repeat-containing protein [Rhizomicrobium sp.]